MNVMNKRNSQNSGSGVMQTRVTNRSGFSRPAFCTVREGKKCTAVEKPQDVFNQKRKHFSIINEGGIREYVSSSSSVVTVKYRSPMVYRSNDGDFRNSPNVAIKKNVTVFEETSSSGVLATGSGRSLQVGVLSSTRCNISGNSSSSSGNNGSTFRTPQVPIVPAACSSSGRNSFVVGTSQSKRYHGTSSGGGHSLRTPKSSTSTGSDKSNHIVVAVTEGRGVARCEVGIAAVDCRRPRLILCQISDTQTYSNTLRKINILNPIRLLVPSTFTDDNISSSMSNGNSNNKLFELLMDTFPNVTLTTVQRKYFNDKAGLQEIESVCLPEYASQKIAIRHKFYALAASAALMKYVEFAQNVVFSPKSLRVEYSGMEDIMLIDVETAKKLELVLSQNTSEANVNANSTLFGVLNKCSTIGGQRKLRSLILQPLSNETVITSRLSCVAELVENVELLCRLKDAASKFWDVEQLLSLCTQVSNFKENTKAAELHVNYALLLKTTLDAVPTLKSTLDNVTSPLLREIRQSLEDARYGKIADRLDAVLNEDAHISKCYTVSQFQRCFAIKPQVCGLLDVARVIYSELVGDFNNNVKELATLHKLPLTVRCLSNKGFVIQLQLKRCGKGFKTNNLPSVFIQVQQFRSTVTMMTKDLLFLKQRINQVLREIQLISGVIVHEMLQDTREHIGCLYKLCENIAELDVIVSFAQISTSVNYTRPIFSKYSTEVKECRHPILDSTSFHSSFVPNDIYASADSNFQIITGPNTSGKSVYIKQVALLQIMAQIGCYVPAEYAEFRICDRIFSRIGFGDSIEYNASSFILEIKEMNYIMNSITGRSLVIIDELGRGTSSEEGTSIAWAICEHLLQSTAFVFFTTHFLPVTKLQDLYYNVTNWHFEADAREGNEDEMFAALDYTHKLIHGVVSQQYYGLRLAQATALPACIINAGKHIAKQLSTRWKPRNELLMTEEMSEDRKINGTVVLLLDLLDNGHFDITTVNDITKNSIAYISWGDDNDSDSDNRVADGGFRFSETAENVLDACAEQHFGVECILSSSSINSGNDDMVEQFQCYANERGHQDVDVNNNNSIYEYNAIKGHNNCEPLVDYSASETNSTTASDKAIQYANITRCMWRRKRSDDSSDMDSERSISCSGSSINSMSANIYHSTPLLPQIQNEYQSPSNFP